jgi:hypothetical protein
MNSPRCLTSRGSPTIRYACVAVTAADHPVVYPAHHPYQSSKVVTKQLIMTNMNGRNLKYVMGYTRSLRLRDKTRHVSLSKYHSREYKSEMSVEVVGGEEV